MTKTEKNLALIAKQSKSERYIEKLTREVEVYVICCGKKP
jgi:hypothetical protein